MDFPLTVTYGCIGSSLDALRDLENMLQLQHVFYIPLFLKEIVMVKKLAAAISFLASLQAEIWLLPV